MKFGTSFQEALQRDEYPREWIESAISYKKLKKCIKSVQQELQSLGLDHATLEKLWQQVGDVTLGDGHMMNYGFLTTSGTKFVPKLTIALDPQDGSPMDAWLSPETRRILRQLGRRQSATGLIKPDGEAMQHAHAVGSVGADVSETPSPQSDDHESAIETVEVPLTSDSEFFQILRRELRNLEKLQRSEQKSMETAIVKLGDDLREVKANKNKRSKEDLEAWREIFRLYLDAQVFLSSHEQDAGVRDAAHAQKQLEFFNKTLASEQGRKIKLSKDSKIALDRFQAINLTLLQLLKYSEINRTALTKILKKFDKRTALHAQQPVLEYLKTSPSFMTKDLAKATCFTISDELLNILPQLDDYLCPVCFSISFKPVRLRCNHVFCIRCLIVMQNADQDKCPLCREHVVLEATGGKCRHNPFLTNIRI